MLLDYNNILLVFTFTSVSILVLWNVYKTLTTYNENTTGTLVVDSDTESDSEFSITASTITIPVPRKEVSLTNDKDWYLKHLNEMYNSYYFPFERKVCSYILSENKDPKFWREEFLEEAMFLQHLIMELEKTCDISEISDTVKNPIISTLLPKQEALLYLTAAAIESEGLSESSFVEAEEKFDYNLMIEVRAKLFLDRKVLKPNPGPHPNLSNINAPTPSENSEINGSSDSKTTSILEVVESGLGGN